MTIKEITLKGEKEHQEIRIKTDKDCVKIYFRDGLNRTHGELWSNAARDDIYTAAKAIQLHLDGFRQTNSTVNEYFELLIQLLRL